MDAALPTDQDLVAIEWLLNTLNVVDYLNAKLGLQYHHMTTSHTALHQPVRPWRAHDVPHKGTRRF